MKINQTYVHTIPELAESVPDRASVHTKNAAFEAISTP